MPEEPKDKPKKAKGTKSKYEELPEIPDYERPPLEKYEKNDFDPTKKVSRLMLIVANDQLPKTKKNAARMRINRLN